MKIRELIEELKKEDPEKMVVIEGYEGGFTPPRVIRPIKLRLNVHSDWYYGPHEEDDHGECDALLLQRDENQW